MPVYYVIGLFRNGGISPARGLVSTLSAPVARTIVTKKCRGLVTNLALCHYLLSSWSPLGANSIPQPVKYCEVSRDRWVAQSRLSENSGLARYRTIQPAGRSRRTHANAHT
ncbi:hypothetical protein CDD83_1528 [Cordyceps sp. RAO-2017]|nr:hypothetical protein CDD83_1528 [Cordyceps sp. RAO-2017]